MAHHSILLVDDEENVRRSLQRMLRAEGYEVLVAESAETALPLLARSRVDLILSDQMMPGMRGLELLRRTLPDHPDAVRILLTGHADLGMAIEAINDGCVYKFILKPWNHEELKVTIRRALEQHDLLLEHRELTERLRQREALLAELDRQHPGITDRPADGIYRIE